MIFFEWTIITGWETVVVICTYLLAHQVEAAASQVLFPHTFKAYTKEPIMIEGPKRLWPVKIIELYELYRWGWEGMDRRMRAYGGQRWRGRMSSALLDVTPHRPGGLTLAFFSLPPPPSQKKFLVEGSSFYRLGNWLEKIVSSWDFYVENDA
jgi:hypothetical protein